MSWEGLGLSTVSNESNTAACDSTWTYPLARPELADPGVWIQMNQIPPELDHIQDEVIPLYKRLLSK